MATLPPDLQEAIDKFDKDAGGVCDSFVGIMNTVPPPPMIYHYTNDEGLKGILENGTVWISDIFSMNDTSEIKHGVELARSILLTKAENYFRRHIASTEVEHRKAAIEVTKFCRRFPEILEKFVEESANYLVCCFSKNGNDLGQWRAYSDDGRGYALESVPRH